jgi:hypothetical protein
MVTQALHALVINTAFWCCAMSVLITGCAVDDHFSETRSATDGLIDCLVPGQIRQLDEQVTYPTQRQMIRTTREECRARGGEEK